MAKSIHLFMLILILHVLQSAFANKSSSLSLADECSLLFQFKENISINNSASSDSHAYPKVASWSLNGSDGAKSCCLWEGVQCRLGHVIGLDLSSCFLYGPISSNNSLFHLIHLRTLNLADNDFRYSQIPSGIGRLSQLKKLYLSYSVFSGEVPKQISQLRNLVSLDLSGNRLKLQSSDFQNLVQYSSETLRELFLSDVNIDSEIPSSLVNSSLLTSLVMSDCGLVGEFPTGIFNLPKLQVLDVHGNDHLTGSIPEFHGNSELKQMFLGYTNFQGSIPVSIGNLTHLNTLNLNNCTFTGTLPASVSNLTQLTYLHLFGSKFTGSLPSLESLSNLTYLVLYGNRFDRWKLPDWFGKLKKITWLDLEDVNLYGEIPSSFFNMTQVKDIYLSRNQLNGQLSKAFIDFQNLETFYMYKNKVTVDFQIFLSLKKLKYLILSGNNITLSVTDIHTNKTQPKFIGLWLTSCNLKVFPEFLRFQHKLEYLYLAENNIEGLIPGWVWNISKETLKELSLTQNLITGFEQHSPVAPWVGLRLLHLAHNMLTGEIPPFVCNFRSLQVLDLSFNNITGLISPCLDKLSNSLVVLRLRSNNLLGTIPNIFTNECKLLVIDLSENKLEGQVPRSLGNCESLQILDLGYNILEDTFPFWLGALSELQVLILTFNKFFGIIRVPSEINVNFPQLRIIDLSYNSFSGDLPHQYFQEWITMKVTKGSETFMQFNTEVNHVTRYYAFSIQITNKGAKLDYEKIMNTFSAVDLSSNMFTGNIPVSIPALSGLQLLNLSNNEISGDIPSSMRNLIHLEALDLSSNKLSGMIPQDLVQLNFLEFFNVSDNNLTGPIPQGKQFNTFSNNSYMRNQALCGYPLSMKCGDSKEPKPPRVSFEEESEPDFPHGIDWVVILSGVVSGLVIGLVCGNYLTTRYYKWFLLGFRK